MCMLGFFIFVLFHITTLAMSRAMSMWKNNKEPGHRAIQGLPLHSALLAHKPRRLEQTRGKTYFVRQEEGVDAGNQVGRVLCIRLATDNDLWREKKEWVRVGKRGAGERKGNERGSRGGQGCLCSVLMR